MGVEPTILELESSVLPLNDPAIFLLIFLYIYYIIYFYGSAEKAKARFEELDLVLSYYVEQMQLALDLLEGDKNLFAICDNIICLGLSQAAGKIMKPKTEKSE